MWVVPLSLWSLQALGLFSLFCKVVIQVKSHSVGSDLCLVCFSALYVGSKLHPLLRTCVPAVHGIPRGTGICNSCMCRHARVLVYNTSMHNVIFFTPRCPCPLLGCICKRKHMFISRSLLTLAFAPSLADLPPELESWGI